MAEAISYVLGFTCLLLTIGYWPKTDRKLNYVINLMFSYVTVLCLGGIGALFMNALKIPIRPFSMAVFFIVLAVMVLVDAIKKRTTQKCYIRKSDIISMIVCVFFVGVVSIVIFTPFIYINYLNPVDPGVHFRMAMNIARNEKIDGMYFTQFYNAMFIRCLSWILPETWTYKAFILSDIFHVIMELLFFLAVSIELLENKNTRWKPLIFSIIYWVGFPLYALTGGYIYWGMAVMLVEYIMILLKWYTQTKNSYKRRVLLLLCCLGCFAVSICYISLAPGIFISLFTVILYDTYYGKKVKINRRVLTFMIVGIVFTIICAAIGYYFIFASKGKTVFGSLKTGVIDIKSLEILVVTPIILIGIIKKVNNGQKLEALQVGFICHLGIQVIMTVMASISLVSDYYLFKPYIVLWFFCFALLYSIDIKSKKILLYGVGTILFLTLSFDSDNQGTVNLKHSMLIYNVSDFVKNNFNNGYMSDHDVVYLFKEAAETYAKEESPVPLVLSGERKGAGGWYQGIYSNGVYLDRNPDFLTIEDIEDYIEEENAEYFVILFDDPLYRDERFNAYFDSFSRVYENAKGFIAKVN